MIIKLKCSVNVLKFWSNSFLCTQTNKTQTADDEKQNAGNLQLYHYRGMKTTFACNADVALTGKA